VKLTAVLFASAAAGAGLMWAALAGRAESDGINAAVAEAPAPTSSAMPASAPSGATQDDAYLDARSKGSPDAPIVVYEASDFQCPYCRDFWEQTLPLLEAEYINTGKIRLVFLNFPLTSIHPNAPAAHEFAMCAAEQGRFWETHDLLFANQREWSSLSEPGPYFRLLMDSLDVSRSDFDDCLASGRVRGVVMAEGQAMFQSGLQSTPSFVIEGGLLPGAQPIDVWRPILDSLVAAKRTP
jgi:protein-disulfide isomerase